MRSLTRVLNVASMALIAVPVASTALHLLIWRAPDASGSQDLPGLMGDAREDRTRRDIYYMVFDRYASNRTLREVYGFDNAIFLNALRERGFHIVSNGNANYLKTGHSLASSLNMTHLLKLHDEIGLGSSDWRPVYQMVRHFAFWRFLEIRGYRYFHLGSWWDPTRSNPHADENFIFDFVKLPGVTINLSHYQSLLLRRTIIEPFRNKSQHELRECRRVRATFDELPSIIGKPGPQFVFVHMLLPHPPYLFDQKGRCMTASERESRTETQNYVGQLRFADREILRVLDDVLAHSETEPIVIPIG